MRDPTEMQLVSGTLPFRYGLRPRSLSLIFVNTQHIAVWGGAHRVNTLNTVEMYGDMNIGGCLWRFAHMLVYAQNNSSLRVVWGDRICCMPLGGVVKGWVLICVLRPLEHVLSVFWVWFLEICLECDVRGLSLKLVLEASRACFECV